MDITIVPTVEVMFGAHGPQFFLAETEFLTLEELTEDPTLLEEHGLCFRELDGGFVLSPVPGSVDTLIYQVIPPGEGHRYLEVPVYKGRPSRELKDSMTAASVWFSPDGETRAL